jgi:hypothetical protein
VSALAVLADPYDRLAWGGVAIALAIALGQLLKWIGYNPWPTSLAAVLLDLRRLTVAI